MYNIKLLRNYNNPYKTVYSCTNKQEAINVVNEAWTTKTWEGLPFKVIEVVESYVNSHGDNALRVIWSCGLFSKIKEREE